MTCPTGAVSPSWVGIDSGTFPLKVYCALLRSCSSTSMLRPVAKLEAPNANSAFLFSSLMVRKGPAFEYTPIMGTAPATMPTTPLIFAGKLGWTSAPLAANSTMMGTNTPPIPAPSIFADVIFTFSSFKFLCAVKLKSVV